MPGTLGSIAALPAALALLHAGGGWLLFCAALAAALAGTLVCACLVRREAASDPPRIVIDEVAGQWLALVPAAADPLHLLAGFVLFRLFDIAKPGPIGWLDRRVEGAPGIMADDIAAGAAAALCLWGLMLI